MEFLIYFICFALGILFTIIAAMVGHLFGDADHGDVGTGGHAEAGFDHTGMPGISFFSPTVMASFVTAFGALGMIFTRIPATSSVWISAPLSALGGLCIAGLVFWVFKTMFEKTQSSSEARVGTLVGQIASIVTPIPKDGVGEIAYVRAGTRYTAPARSEQGEAISAGQAVRITRVIGQQFWVDLAARNQTAAAKESTPL
jgi:membrane protein implicated in regulation of membrane protease activity